jgi:hypothetical protein
MSRGGADAGAPCSPALAVHAAPFRARQDSTTAPGSGPRPPCLRAAASPARNAFHRFDPRPRDRGRPSCAPLYVRAFRPRTLSPGAVGTPCHEDRRAVLPIHRRARPFGRPPFGTGRCSSPISATDQRHEHSPIVRFSSRPLARSVPTRRSTASSAPRRLAATRPRAGACLTARSRLRLRAPRLFWTRAGLHE